MEDNQPVHLQKNQSKCELTIEQRKLNAQKYYQYFKKHTTNCTKNNSIQQYIERDSKQQHYSFYQNHERPQSTQQQAKNIKIQHSLMILQGLSEGKNITQIYRQNLKMQEYPMSKFKNAAKLTLQRLSKIFVDLLPNNLIQLNSKQFYQKYFRTRQMLQFYKNNNLDLLPTFHHLFFIKNWEKENKEYLKRGYSKDYLPDEIKNKIAALPLIYRAIREVYDKYGGSLKTKQKRKCVKKSSRSIQEEQFQKDEFMQSERAQSL